MFVKGIWLRSSLPVFFRIGRREYHHPASGEDAFNFLQETFLFTGVEVFECLEAYNDVDRSILEGNLAARALQKFDLLGSSVAFACVSDRLRIGINARHTRRRSRQER